MYLPNTTPLPNEIIEEWLSSLKGSELKVLLVIVRQTLGWVIDTKTGMRKEEDWISYSQMMDKTGLGTEATSSAVDNLVKYKLIQVRDEDGNELATKEDRQAVGKKRGKLFYRLNITTSKNMTHYFEKQSSTTSKTEDNKNNSLQNKLLQKKKKIIKRKTVDDITQEDIENIARDYKISTGRVVYNLEQLKAYIPNRTKKPYKDHLAALRQFVLRDIKQSVERASSYGNKTAIDASNV